MPVGDEYHRVVARAMTAFLGRAEERRDFVVGEVIVEARFAGHANTLSRPPAPSSPLREFRASMSAIQKTPRHRDEPLPANRFFGITTRNITPKVLRLSA